MTKKTATAGSRASRTFSTSGIRGSSSLIDAGLTTEAEPARGVYGAVELQAPVFPLSKPSAKSAPGTTSVRQALRPWVKA